MSTQPCDICARPWLMTVEHHCLTRGSGKHEVPAAKLNLCAFCHSLVHNGAITVNAQLAIAHGREHPEIAENARQQVYDVRRARLT